MVMVTKHKRQKDRMTALRPWHWSHLIPHYITGPLHGDQAQGGHRDPDIRPGDSAAGGHHGGHQHQVSLGLRLRPGAVRGNQIMVSSFGVIFLT